MQKPLPPLFYETQSVLPNKTPSCDQFRFSVAIDGNKAIIGAYKDNSNGKQSGAAYFYLFNGFEWIQHQKITPPDTESNDQFGFKVAINGNQAIISACCSKNSAGESSGAVYFYEFKDLSWRFQQKVSSPDGVSNNFFGYSIGISNTQAIIGTYSNKNNNAGSVYIYKLKDSTWNFREKIIAHDNAANDSLIKQQFFCKFIKNLKPSHLLFF